jgi:NTE family protein
MTPSGKRVALVLGAGGMKGLAHVGVLKVLETLRIEVDEYIGASVGAIIGALAAGGMRADDIARLWNRLRRQPLLDFNSLGLIAKGAQAPSLYQGRKLRAWLKAHLPGGDFTALPKPLYVCAVELNTGVPVVWGNPGFTACPVHEAVYASCAIPGIFPPRKIGDFHFIDGAVVDPLPVGVAVGHGCGAIVAVNLQYLDYTAARPVQDAGVVSILGRANTIVGHTMSEMALTRHAGAPILLIRPRVADHGVLEFAGATHLVKEGMRAAMKALTGNPLLQ